MKKLLTMGLAGLFTLGAATTAMAAEPQFYISGHLGYNTWDLPPGAGVEDDSWGFGALIGAEFDTGNGGLVLGVEGGWQDFGNLDGLGGLPDAEFDGFTAGVKAALPISNDGNTRVIGRVGYLWWDGEQGASSGDGEDWYFGGGLDHLISPQFRLGADLQYQSLDLGGGVDVDVYAWTLRGTFLF